MQEKTKYNSPIFIISLSVVCRYILSPGQVYQRSVIVFGPNEAACKLLQYFWWKKWKTRREMQCRNEESDHEFKRTSLKCDFCKLVIPVPGHYFASNLYHNDRKDDILL